MPVSRVFDVLRVKLALFILQLSIFSNRAHDHDTVFRAAWALSKRLGFLFNAFSSSGNPWGYEVRHVVYLRLLRLLHRQKPGYIPKVTVVNEDVFAHMARSTSPTIIVTVHSPTDTVISRILEDRGIKSSLLAANPQTVGERAALLGCRGQLDFIAQTENTLLQIRRDLRRNRVVHLCIDFREDNSASPALFMSSAVFRISELMTLNIVFLDTRITADGCISVYTHVHDTAETTGPDGIASAFVHWLKTTHGHTRDWTIVPNNPLR